MKYFTVIDPCTAGTAGCSVNASCAINDDGTANCTCDEGFTGDGMTCTGKGYTSGSFHISTTVLISNLEGQNIIRL